VVEALVEAMFGRTVGITGLRRWDEQAELLRARGAGVVHGLTVGPDLLDPVATIAATELTLSAPLDVVVLTTPSGVSAWFAAAARRGLDDALRTSCANAVVLARGPKTAIAARELGLAPSWISDGETNQEILELLVGRGVRSLRVAVQRDGGRPWLADALGRAGARVVDVPIYRWSLPADLAPARRLLDAACAGALDAVTFTSTAAVHHAFAIAADGDELRRAFGAAVLAVVIGPVTAAALREHGVGRIVAPPEPRLAAMVGTLAIALDHPVSAAHRTVPSGELQARRP
jgi:uroporphyrinogen-III synthase